MMIDLVAALRQSVRAATTLSKLEVPGLLHKSMKCHHPAKMPTFPGVHSNRDSSLLKHVDGSHISESESLSMYYVVS